MKRRLGAIIFSEGQDDYVATVAALLRARKKTLALAESCTGGLLAQLITHVRWRATILSAVSSFMRTKGSKRSHHVRLKTLAAHGAVSGACRS